MGLYNPRCSGCRKTLVDLLDEWGPDSIWVEQDVTKTFSLTVLGFDPITAEVECEGVDHHTIATGRLYMTCPECDTRTRLNKAVRV